MIDGISEMRAVFAALALSVLSSCAHVSQSECELRAEPVRLCAELNGEVDDLLAEAEDVFVRQLPSGCKVKSKYWISAQGVKTCVNLKVIE